MRPKNNDFVAGVRPISPVCPASERDIIESDITPTSPSPMDLEHTRWYDYSRARDLCVPPPTPKRRLGNVITANEKATRSLKLHLFPRCTELRNCLFRDAGCWPKSRSLGLDERRLAQRTVFESGLTRTEGARMFFRSRQRRSEPASVPLAGKVPASMNPMMAAVVLSLVLNGCVGKPPAEVLIPVSAPLNGAKSVAVLAATTRAREKDSPYGFTADRSEAINYQDYTVSIPPSHVPGKIEWPSQTPGNAQTDFVVTSSRPLTEAGMAEAIKAELASRKDEHGSVLVFVHGYNTNYPETVFRGAELATDLRATAGAMVVFSWPSRATLTGYVADRESATYSRDYLERVLDEIAAIPNVGSINLVAHSMGNWLAVETLRQARLREHSPFLKKLNQVVLLAPDIDVDVFKTQLEAIGPLRHPIIVAVSKDDRALSASKLIAGRVSRVGNVLLDDPRARATIERYGIDVVDLSQVNSSDYFGHSKFVEALPELQNIAASGGARTTSGPGIFLLNSAGQILSAPAAIGNAVLDQ